jgi:hypothetical protein
VKEAIICIPSNFDLDTGISVLKERKATDRDGLIADLLCCFGSERGLSLTHGLSAGSDTQRYSKRRRQLRGRLFMLIPSLMGWLNPAQLTSKHD